MHEMNLAALTCLVKNELTTCFQLVYPHSLLMLVFILTQTLCLLIIAPALTEQAGKWSRRGQLGDCWLDFDCAVCSSVAPRALFSPL